MIGDHGAGWHGVAWDDATGNHLNPADVRDAIATGLTAAGRERADIVGFDACLMATFEVGA
ncbi:MAG TPA: clostripain-related cysteine peptidase, partial [Ilumatobacteraceae bacterium]|nr:clostripain-related cysteine peptidase [Ilumatobacteraceae bacterium]